MKIKVTDLEPNPFRHIEKYPIDKTKVEALKTSIREKTFWDNILVRPHTTKSGKYQIAYGHHRHIALKELGIKEIDIPCREIDDSTMLKIMAEENLNWSTSPAITTQTVLTVKEYLDEELIKYDDLKLADKFISQLFENQQAFANAKRKDTGGVGRETILKFLGGNWKHWMVEEALAIIKDEELDQKAILTIPTMGQARAFHSSVKEHKTPKPIQKHAAKKIVTEGIGKRDIPALVEQFSPPIPNLTKKKKKKSKKLPNIVEYVFKLENDTFDMNRRLKALIPEMSELANQGRLFGRLMPALKKLDNTILKLRDDYEQARKEKKKVASI